MLLSGINIVISWLIISSVTFNYFVIMYLRGGIPMKCGAKCFTVEAEINGKMQSIPVTARTSIQARKALSLEYGNEIKIIAVKADPVTY